MNELLMILHDSISHTSGSPKGIGLSQSVANQINGRLDGSVNDHTRRCRVQLSTDRRFGRKCCKGRDRRDEQQDEQTDQTILHHHGLL